MNNLIFWLYLADVIGNIGSAFCVIGVILGVVSSIGWTVCKVCENDDMDAKTFKPFARTAALVCYFLLFIGMLMPTQKFMYTAIALKTGEAAVTAVQGSEVGQKAYTLLNQKLDELLKNDDHKGTDK